ncbi:hypothetical protein KI688_011733 [Linnemannia hyalina]|uniref:Large-conductance mechanosensitive channel n=1 Tax=Linnemannia hyalina TaxID=64524 RepID=A0A9P8BUD5_9FUNG|nr:hypothetical protein KI688_011733 [Linnemannia hyalina]
MSAYNKEAAAYELEQSNQEPIDSVTSTGAQQEKAKKRGFNPVKVVTKGSQAVVGGVVGGIGQGASAVRGGISQVEKGVSKAGDTLVRVPGVNYGVSFFSDYRKFMDRGNVIDLAVAVVIGAAFTAIVTSLVTDIITPIIALASGKNLEENFLILRHNPLTDTTYSTRAQAQADHSITWNWGNFIQTVINFFIVSACVFIIVKIYQASRNTKTEVTEKACDYCMKKIPVEAVRCPECTTWLDWDACTKVKNMEHLAAGGGLNTTGLPGMPVPMPFNPNGLAAGAVSQPYMGSSNGVDSLGRF